MTTKNNNKRKENQSETRKLNHIFVPWANLNKAESVF